MYTKETRNEIIKFYKECKRVNKTADHFKINRTTIRSILIESGIRTKGDKLLKTRCNETYFDKIDTEDKAYWLGYIVADGCNRTKYFSISSTDKNTLEKFKTSIEFTGKIYTYPPNGKTFNKKDLHVIVIPSIKICDRLRSLNVTERKSNITSIPNIEKILIPHFIRGVFDGDGCIHRRKNEDVFMFVLCGSNTLMMQIKEILKKDCKVDKLYSEIKTPNLTRIVAYTKKDCIKIKDYFYNNATIFLERKKKVFDIIKYKFTI